MLSAGIALAQLVPDLAVEVVVGVLGFPQAARHAQGISDCPVRLVAAIRAQFRYKHEPFGVFLAVFGQAVQERQTDVFLVGRSAELDEFAELLVVAVYVRVGRHTVSPIVTARQVTVHV